MSDGKIDNSLVEEIEVEEEYNDTCEYCNGSGESCMGRGICFSCGGDGVKKAKKRCDEPYED